MKGMLLAICVGVSCILQAHAAVDTFVLLPDQQGITGAIIITSPKGSKLLKKTYSMVKVDEQGNFTVIKSNDLCVDKSFDDSLTAIPKPKSFLLHFLPASTTLDADADNTLDAVIQHIKATPSPFVVIQGNADLIASVKALLQKQAMNGLHILLDNLIDVSAGMDTDTVKITVH